MPRPTRAYGRAGTPVIPADWATSHGVVVGATWMSSQVNLRVEGGTPVFDPVLGHTVTTAHTPFVSGVPANIAALTSAEVTASDVADDMIRVLGYLVTIPATVVDAALDEGILVDVTVSADPMLRGATLTVTDIVRGDRMFERALVCTLNT